MSATDRRNARATVARLRGEIDRANASLRDSIATASGALDAAAAAHAAAEHELAGAVRAATLSDAPTYAPWSSPSWRNWTCEPRVPAELRLGEFVGNDPLPATAPVFDGRTLVVATDSEAASQRGC